MNNDSGHHRSNIALRVKLKDLSLARNTPYNLIDQFDCQIIRPQRSPIFQHDTGYQ